MHAFLDSAGERLAIECSLPWVMELIAEGAAGELRESEAAGAAITIRVEADRGPFDTRGWNLLARGAWLREGELVIENACTAGFDLHLRHTAERAVFTYRWRPPARDRAAARILRSRFHLLARGILTQYPALWWAGTRGRAPLHASACVVGGATLLVTASSGIGRSTLVLGELRAGGRATGDNLGVGDGSTLWGLLEPLRVEGEAGAACRMGATRSRCRTGSRRSCLTASSSSSEDTQTAPPWPLAVPKPQPAPWLRARTWRASYGGTGLSPRCLRRRPGLARLTRRCWKSPPSLPAGCPASRSHLAAGPNPACPTFCRP